MTLEQTQGGAAIADPRSPRTTVRRKGPNLEKWGWIYMRASGVLLVVLIFGHLFVNLMLGEGIHGIDFAFVAGKFASPFWQWWDVLMLWLALIHGANGMRTIVNDYTSPGVVQKVLKGALFAAAAVLIILGTLVVFTFEPCPVGAPADLLPSFCAA
jgi:succinate dehydrogenase / fumarate reductase membrane anchor subunit